MRTHPGRSVSIYEIGQISATAFEKCMTPSNILAGFRCTGIFPLNTEVFGDEFEPSAVTDQPQPLVGSAVELTVQLAIETVAEPAVELAMESAAETAVERTTEPAVESLLDAATPSTSNQTAHAQTFKNMAHITPESIAPLPKAQPRKPKTTSRRKVTSAILTDTPEKNRIQAEADEKASKKRQKKPVNRKKKKAVALEDDSTSEEELAREMLDSDSDSPNEELVHGIPPVPTMCTVQVNSHVLVKYPTRKNSNIYYVGVILDLDAENKTFGINYMKKVNGTAVWFTYPEREDRDQHVPLSDIVLLLGNPVTVGGTSRSVTKVMFTVDLSEFNVQ